MKTRLLILLSFLILHKTNFSQKTSYGRKYANELPKEYLLDVSSLRDHILNGIPSEMKTEHKRLTYQFADQQAYYISKKISQGSVYSDWDELESYVNEVMQKILPEKLKSDKRIHAYIVRDGSFNASMTTSGHMFIHIGIFSQITDETTLAFLLAHEVAHYYHQHSLKEFIKEETSWVSENESQNISIDNELESDQYAMQWLYDAGYHIDGIHKCLRILDRIDKKTIKKLEKTWKLESTSHPSSDARLEQINLFYKDHHQPDAPKYIISKEKFEKLKKESKPEILKTLLNDFQYTTCIEEAFKFHIFDPDNEAYIYYMLESIRRYCYLNPSRWNKNFVTNRYYENGEEGQDKHKMTSHFFTKFELDLIGIAPKEGSKIKARFYWEGEPKFTTYEGAFDFFSRVAKVMECKECILTDALSFEGLNNKMRDTLLTKYLKNDDIIYRDYAQTILDDEIISSLTDKKLLVFNDFYIYVNQGQESIPIRLKTNGDNSYISTLFDTVATKFEDRIPVFLPDLKKSGINDFKLFTVLKSFASISIISKGIKTQMHIVNPDYYELFQRYGVNEVEFITCRYIEYHKKEKTEEAYSAIAELDYATIFNQTKKTRFMEVQITSVREMEDQLMKIKYYGGENKIKFKGIGKEEILNEITSQIYLKDGYSKERDRLYQIYK